jgi:hypothetical protein
MKTEEEIFNELFKNIDTSPGTAFDPLEITIAVCKTAAKVLHEVQVEMERFKIGLTK